MVTRMAEAPPPPPGAGAILRADFGQGVDQSADAWKVPPSQLSELVNGRLDRVGSVRKRYGYAGTTPPGVTANLPISVDAARQTLTTVDGVVDTDNDSRGNWKNEANRTARDFAPAGVYGWRPRGPASDVLGDIEFLDATAGETDDAFDMAAIGNFIFVAKCTKAPGRQGPTATQVTLTLSMYDATTRALIDVETTVINDAIYPKLLVNASQNILICTYARPFTRVAIDVAIVPAQIQIFTTEFSNAGFGVQVFAPTIDDGTWCDLTAFDMAPEHAFRPLVPYDVAAAPLTGANYFTVVWWDDFAKVYRESLYNQDPSLGLIIVSLMSWTGGPTAFQYFPVALSISEESNEGRVFAIAAVYLEIDMAVNDKYLNANPRIEMSVIDVNASALVSRTNTAYAPLIAGFPSFVGGVTCVQTFGTPVVPRWLGTAEIWNSGGHFLAQKHVDSAGLDYGTAILSSAVPTARPFALDYFVRDPTTGKIAVRMPLAVGASQETWVGRAVGSPYGLQTNLAANYPANIGTAILTSAIQRRTTLVNGPLATVAPRLLPTSPPRPFVSNGLWYVPHRAATDGTGSYTFSTIRLSQRERGDVLNGVYSQSQTLAGGVLLINDGEQLGEAAIIDRPRVHQVLPAGGVGVDFAAGDYLAQAVLAYTDNQGNTHTSAPSDPCRFAVTAITGSSLVFYLSTPSYIGRTDAVIELYMTSPNGVILRKVATFPCSNGGFMQNGVFTYTLVDINTGIGQGLPGLSAQSLYTTGGVLPHSPVPSCRFAVTHSNRLFVGGSDDRRNVYYSAASIPGQAAVFPVGNLIRLEADIACTALGTLNDKIVLFSPFNAYAVFGQYRDETGAGDAISPPQNISDIGCLQPSSVVETPAGLIFFGADDRFHLVNERMEIVPIGAKIQTLTMDAIETSGTNVSAYKIVRAAVLIPEEREVRFYVENADAITTRAILVYNWAMDQWSVDYLQANVTNTQWGGACYGALGVLTASATEWLADTRTQWRDANNYPQLEVVTAWIQPSGTQGRSRMRYAQILGRVAGTHNLSVAVYTDFDELNVKASATWDNTQLAPVAGTSYPEQIRLQIAGQKTQAVKIKITDANSSSVTGNGRGPELVGLAIEVLPLAGLTTLPNARKG